MIRPSDAWTLARLLAGHSVNGELKTIAEPFRRLAEHLNGLLPNTRQAAWEAAMTGRDDRDELTSAIASVDPSEPQPEADSHEEGTSADEWGPIRLGSMPPAEPFPLDVFPEDVARLVSEGADAIGCPPDFLALDVLAVTGGTIGRSVSLLLKSNYFAGPTIFAACVGPPSDGKTPAFKLVATAVRQIARILAEVHAQAYQAWKDEVNRPAAKGEKKPKPPAPPKPRRIDVDDITMESIPMRLADNPRGLIMLRDELTAFVTGMNQYKSGGKGSDRSVAMKIWSGDSITRDRVTDESGIPCFCEHPCMTILGGLPPDMLGTLQDAKGCADGFVDRFLFAYPDPLPVCDWSEDGVSPETMDTWCKIIARIWDRSMNSVEGRDLPHVARFTREGKVAWKRNYNAHAAEMRRDDFPPSMRGPWGKLREYAGRFAVILACLDHASDPTSPDAVPEVDAAVVDDAWRLVAYFKSHARRVHAVIARGSGIGGGKTSDALVIWLKTQSRRSFTESEAKQARRWINDDDLTDALRYLVNRNVIRPRAISPERPKGGRPPSPAYAVNPSLLDTENATNPKNSSE